MTDLEKMEQELVEQVMNFRGSSATLCPHSNAIRLRQDCSLCWSDFIRAHANALVAAMAEACAKHLPLFQRYGEICKCSCGFSVEHNGFTSWQSHIRSLTLADAEKELERRIIEAIEDESRNPWKQAIVEELLVECAGGTVNEQHAKRALHQIIRWNQAVALDPAVSKEMHDRLAEAERKGQLKVLLSLCQLKTNDDTFIGSIKWLRDNIASLSSPPAEETKP